MHKNPTLWYIRSEGIISGPFTASIIKNNLLLGRLHPKKDQASIDQSNWHLIDSIAPLHIDYNIEKAVNSKRNLDERNGFDRRNPIDKEQSTPQNRAGDRRRIEAEHDIQHRQFRTLLMHKFRNKKDHIFWPLIAVFSFLAILFILAFSYAKPFPTSQSNCDLPPSEGVNWTNCLKPQLNLEGVLLNNAHLRNSQLVGSNLMNATLSGSDLSYSDLRFTNLSYSQLVNVTLLGANLKNADLSYADLSNSNLSYADLSNANLGGSKLDNVRFDHAIWIDGRICAQNSVGTCVTASIQNP